MQVTQQLLQDTMQDTCSKMNVGLWHSSQFCNSIPNCSTNIAYLYESFYVRELRLR